MKLSKAAVVFSTLTLALLNGCSVFGIRSGYEQLAYTVIDKVDDIEIRRYPSRMAAEVATLKNDNDSFMALFGYISGKNSADANVAMTTPVQVDKTSIKIAMTAPVETKNVGEDGTRMRFFLPRSFTAESAPKPTDPRIKIVSLPEETLAAITYSGSGSEERFQRESARLEKLLAATKWKPVAAPSFLGYDPPLTIPFLRRNEVVVKVEAQ